MCLLQLVRKENGVPTVSNSVTVLMASVMLPMALAYVNLDTKFVMRIRDVIWGLVVYMTLCEGK